jgi:hypothetical protein
VDTGLVLSLLLLSTLMLPGFCFCRLVAYILAVNCFPFVADIPTDMVSLLMLSRLLLLAFLRLLAFLLVLASLRLLLLQASLLLMASLLLNILSTMSKGISDVNPETIIALLLKLIFYSPHW